jgi:hypothetical protein
MRIFLLVFALLAAACSDDGSETFLSVRVIGNGTVSAPPPDELACRDACSLRYDLDATGIVTLTATPDDGWVFARWEPLDDPAHPCSGTAPTHTVDLATEHEEDQALGCRAVFEPVQAGETFVHSGGSEEPQSSYWADYLFGDGTTFFGGDVAAAVPGNGVDGIVVSISADSTQVVRLPAVQPNAGAALPDGSTLIGGRILGSTPGAFLGVVAPDGSLGSQANVGGASNVIELELVDDEDALAAGRLSNGDVFVSALTAQGVFGGICRIATAAFPNDLATRADGGWILTLSEFLSPGRRSYVVSAGPDFAIDWQVEVAGGFAELVSAAEAEDGGVFAVGRVGGTLPTSRGLVVRFDASGALVWQRAYGGDGEIMLNAVIPTETGVRVIGSGLGHQVIAMDLDMDGEVDAATSFDNDTETLGNVLGAFPTERGGLAIGTSNASLGLFTALETDADIIVASCSDPGIGAAVDPADILTGTATGIFTVSALAQSGLIPLTTTPTAVVPAVESTTPIDRCAPGT